MQFLVELKNLKIEFDSLTILKDINLQVKYGEFIYIIGKTGSGKSSILKTLYADIPVIFGEAKIANFDLKFLSKSKIPELRRKIGIIFQDFQLLLDRNVSENLSFVLKATGWKSRYSILKRINEVLTIVGLSGKSNKMPHLLSGGEQQRLVIARSILNDPSIIIADEPTANLDPEVTNEIINLFYDINKRGTAIIMATHNYNTIKQSKNSKIFKCSEDKSFLQFDYLQLEK